MDRICVFLYSRHSTTCVQILQVLKESPVNLTTTVGLVSLSIDNKKIRQQLQTSSQVTINTVPCILVVYRDGNTEKYEGASAINWIDNAVKKLAPVQLPPQLPPQPRNNQVVYKQEPEQDVVRKVKNNPRTSTQPNNTRKTKPPVQNLEELEDLDDEIIEENSTDENSDEENTPKPPRVGIREGPGNYDMNTKFKGKKPQVGQVRGRTKSGAATTGTSSSSLMTAAMAMQKERESIDGSKRK